MRPELAPDNGGDVALIDSELARNFALEYPQRIKKSNFTDVFVCKLCPSVLFAKMDNITTPVLPMLDVVGLRANNKMVRINARRIVARMQYRLSNSNVPPVKYKGSAMGCCGSEGCFSRANRSIPKPPDPGKPQPAWPKRWLCWVHWSGLVDLGKKSRFEAFGKIFPTCWVQVISSLHNWFLRLCRAFGCYNNAEAISFTIFPSVHAIKGEVI